MAEECFPNGSMGCPAITVHYTAFWNLIGGWMNAFPGAHCVSPLPASKGSFRVRNFSLHNFPSFLLISFLAHLTLIQPWFGRQSGLKDSNCFGLTAWVFFFSGLKVLGSESSFCGLVISPSMRRSPYKTLKVQVHCKNLVSRYIWLF